MDSIRLISRASVRSTRSIIAVVVSLRLPAVARLRGPPGGDTSVADISATAPDAAPDAARFTVAVLADDADARPGGLFRVLFILPFTKPADADCAGMRKRKPVNDATGAAGQPRRAQLQLWSMAKPYPTSVTLSRINS